jgi:addiction module RelB/DinJ family antitoxin
MKTVISIKTDREVKENAQKLAARMGLSLSHVVNASLRNFIMTREVHFADVPQMTPELESLLGKVEKDIKFGDNLSPAFANAKDMDKYLDSV